MTEALHGFSRRRFLSGVAILGVTPLYSQVASLPLFNSEKKWTGDNFDEAHALQRNPYAVIRHFGPPVDHPDPYDVIVVGGGISGLTVAYKLRDRNILLLEREQETGGVSKSAEWEGIKYSLGAAYMVHPAPRGEDEIERGSQEDKNLTLLKELNLEKDWRVASEGDGCVFTNARVVPEEKVYNRDNITFFETVASHDHFPSIPPKNKGLVKDLDSVSFKEFLRNPELQQKLYGKTVGAISSEGWESIEYYFWGAFGTNTWETSAYHGLNFFAAEFTKILIFPGGNAFIAKRLAARIRERNSNIIQTGHYVLEIEPDKEGRGYVVLSYHRGEGQAKDTEKIHRYRARTVVFASPLFLAKRIIPRLPTDQVKAIESLDYRSFVVANVLLRRRMNEIFRSDDAETDKERRRLRDGYELRRIHDLDVSRYLPDVISSKGVFSDVVVADFAIRRAAQHAVLTLYRPYPYAHGRDRLRYLTYDYVEKEIREAVLDGFSAHGLRATDIVDIRLTRWGHPMIIPRPGQLTDGSLQTACRSDNGLFFAHTDVQGAPAIENALASAYAAVEGVMKLLG